MNNDAINTGKFSIALIMGVLLGVILSTIVWSAWYAAHPTHLTKEEAWAHIHTKEIDWAMNRYSKIQSALESTYLAEPSITIVMPTDTPQPGK